MKTREFFQIRQVSRRYDRITGKFTINIAYETAAPEPSDRVVGVAEAFGLGLDQWQKFVIYDNLELKIGPTDIVYITGDSGSGKSVLLKALEKDIRRDMDLNCINMVDIKPALGKPLIETIGKTLNEALELAGVEMEPPELVWLVLLIEFHDVGPRGVTIILDAYTGEIVYGLFLD